MTDRLAQRVYTRMKALGCRFHAINIVYLEDSDSEGNPLPRQANGFNSRSLLLRLLPDGSPLIIYNALATTKPGVYYDQNPMNPDGAFFITPDIQFHEAWQFGIHGHGPYAHSALIQCGMIQGTRDGNGDGIRPGDPTVTGDDFGVDQHGIHGYYQPPDDIGRASAGCLVRQDVNEHVTFMRLLWDYHSPSTLFDTIVLDTAKL